MKRPTASTFAHDARSPVPTAPPHACVWFAPALVLAMAGCSASHGEGPGGPGGSTPLRDGGGGPSSTGPGSDPGDAGDDGGDSACTFSDANDFRPPGVETCLGRVAESVFRRAVCSCSDVTMNGDTEIVGFDSSEGPFMPGRATDGASVAANGKI